MKDDELPFGMFYPADSSKNPEEELAQKCKRLGITKAHYLKMREDGLRLTARALKWNSATTDEAMLGLYLVADKTWNENN
jgi:hypothetical protein